MSRLTINWPGSLTLTRCQSSSAHTLGVVQCTLYAATQAYCNTAYQTLVWPKLEYASIAWSRQTPGKIRKLESIQNMTACFVTHKYNYTTSITGLKMSLNWPTLESRRNYRDWLTWYKTHHGLIHINFPDSVSQEQRLGCHNHPLAYRQFCLRVETYQHSLFAYTIPLWNGLLPASVATATTPPPAFQRLAMSNLFGLATP